MQTSDKILNFLRYNGPSLPTAVSKNIKEDALIASAYLGELKSSGKVEITKMKIGTSPLYYLVGQEAQLQNYVGKILSGKDLQVFELLKRSLVLRENNLDLLHKVALRKMPDFAKPLQVDVGLGPEIFWRWYMTTGPQVNQVIRELLYGQTIQTPVQTNPQTQVQPSSGVTSATNQQVQRQAPVVSAPVQTPVQNTPNTAAQHTATHSLAANQEQVNLEKQASQTRSNQYPPNTTVREEDNGSFSYPPNTANVPRGDSLARDVPQAPVTAELASQEEKAVDQIPDEMALEEGLSVQEDSSEVVVNKVASETVEDAPVESEKVAEPQSKLSAVETKPVEKQDKNLETNQQKTEEEVQRKKTDAVEDAEVKEDEKPVAKSLVQKIKEKLMGSSKKKIGDFLPEVLAHFDKKDMKVESHEVVRKNSEIDLKVLVPSKVGPIMVFVKAKRKARCDEKDLSAAYMEAQMEKLPLVFMYTGTLSKKAEDFLESGEFVNLLLLKLDLE